jgi:hypothetical protein
VFVSQESMSKRIGFVIYASFIRNDLGYWGIYSWGFGRGTEREV